MKDTITFEKAKIKANLQGGGPKIVNNLRIVTSLSGPIARSLDIYEQVFDSKGVIRNGATELGFTELIFENAWFKFEIGQESIELAGVTIGKLQLKHQGDGKKKPKRVMAAFTVRYAGDLQHLPLQEFLRKFITANGLCTLKLTVTPEQQKLTETTNAAGPAVIEKKYVDGDFTANITVKEMLDGSHMTRRAAAGGKKLPQVAAAVFSSENDAVAFGAAEVKAFADKIVAGGTKPEKAKAFKMSEWAAALTQVGKPSQVEEAPRPSGKMAAAGDKEPVN